ncbi:hypothetical protein ACOSQ3_033272 [Xanthoceras sorbifolium]
MASKTQIQELQFSKFLESRKKVDGYWQIEPGNAQFMENAASMILQNNENASEFGSQSNSRNSLAWDNAFFTSPGILDPEELFGTLNFREMEHRVEMPGMVACKTVEQERTSRNSEFYSRRSLAWDSAFFTSAGVLDPEELSIVNKGFKEFGADQNPGIEEKIRRSAGLDCTINSDGCSLASLEIDLFDDSKASLHVSSEASNAATSSSKQGRGNNLQNTHSMKISDASSRVRMKSTPASRRQNINTNGSERIGKATSLPPRAQQVARGGDCNPLSSLKQSKILDRVNSPSTAVTKRASPCSKHTKLENKATKAASGQPMTLSKRPCLRNSYSVIPESATYLKSPSSGSHTSRNESAGRSCVLSKSACKSPLKSLREKFDVKMTASCSFSPKSSESSASINQTSDNSIEIMDTSTPCKENSFDADASQASNSNDKRFRYQQVNNISTGDSPVLTAFLRNIKPSGLRMPSPKIGFFDAENSVALTPNGDLKYHSGAHSSGSKTGRVNGNQKGAANGTTRSTKLRSIGDSLRTGNPKLISPLGIRASHPGIMQNNRESMKSLRDKKQALKENEDSKTHSSEKNILQILNEEDKENLCNYYNQVDGLSKHIEAIDLNRDLVMELNEAKTPSKFQFGTKNPRKHSALVSVSYSGENLLHG